MMEKNSTTMPHDHVETVQLATKDQGTPIITDIEDISEQEYAIRTRRLLRKIGIRLVPLCAFLYLLHYLDRGNIGNAKVLNSETKDDLLSQTKTSAHGYAMTLTVFAIAYSAFDVPSNIVMKRYVLPSRWLATLLFCWGALTLGFAVVKNFETVVVLRFFIGVFEAGFFPGMDQFPLSPTRSAQLK
jgi:sugar phosphate permease